MQTAQLAIAVAAAAALSVALEPQCQVCAAHHGPVFLQGCETMRLVEPTTSPDEPGPSCYRLEAVREPWTLRSLLLGQPWYVYVLILWVLSAVEKYFQ